MQLSTKTLLALSLAHSLSANAATVELSLFYPEPYELDSSVSLSSEVVGFYRSIEVANDLFTRKGVNLELKPTHVASVSSWTGSENVQTGRSDMDNGATEVETDVGDMAVGLFLPKGSTIGYGENINSSNYTWYPNVTAKIGVAINRTLGTGGNNSYPFVLAHEVLHSIGAMHDQAAAVRFNDDSLGREDGFPGLCESGYGSLMTATMYNIPFEKMSLSGASDCNGNPSANMVGFTNHYAPLASEFEVGARNNQSVRLTVTENINDQTFDFVAQRNNTATAESMTLYIAGGTVHNGSNSLAPQTIEFQAGQGNSETIKVDFTTLHPIFDASHQQINSTYAVVVGQNEVQNALIDVAALSTQWEPTITPDTGTPNPDNGGGGDSGGSTSLFALLMMLCFGYIRKKHC
ncbi:GlyGly-CTERM sorting domain-containing protein [Aliivibrio fischeri]|uniref:Gammaproteobacterial enzyme C-transmembrane domain protein n=1 Tax=Aliivibrio fischeri (strain MJ11) TaxID=388396 RepID=B5EWD8_ALIFM|nr:GlyGly-CTERM sorting domain-containing protein [Aliivibrio fischeri]ACH64740.1 gammaproteobacterial enzyme C- transmembrane domain protein [Aliivibrio fischeri MJ11]MUK37550.1 GlyGly-CTERM sorting domain-containing protein [Aliivibrio fischeri]